MNTHTKILLRSALGAAFGAISGAALLGVPTYLSTETGFLGPTSAWAPLAAIVGCIWGLVPGALIGFFAAKFQTSKLAGTIVGASVGLCLLVGLLVDGLDPFLDREIFNTAIGGIPIGGAIGLILSATNKGHGKTS